MNRVQFMEQLKKLLSDISEEERQEALRVTLMMPEKIRRQK